MWARRRRRVSSAAERWLWLRWGRGCSRVSARPSRDLAEIQPRDSGDPAERQRRDSSLASAIALREASSLPQDTSQTLPFGGTTRVEGTSCPLHFPDTSKTPLAPLHISLRRDPRRRHLFPLCRRGHPGELSRTRVGGAAGGLRERTCPRHVHDTPLASPAGVAGGPRERSVRADALKGSAEPESQKNALRES